MRVPASRYANPRAPCPIVQEALGSCGESGSCFGMPGEERMPGQTGSDGSLAAGASHGSTGAVLKMLFYSSKKLVTSVVSSSLVRHLQTLRAHTSEP